MAVETIPPPVGGWNTRDAPAAMGPTDAMQLDNWIPRDGYCETRPGTSRHNTSLTTCETLCAWEGKTSTKLIAASGAHLYDATTANSASSLKSGLANNRWQHTSFQAKLVLCNGADNTQVYDGTAVADLTVTSGPASNTLYGCYTFKGRVYYWKQNDQSVYYCAAGAYQGVLTEFKLDAQLTRGGYLVLMTSMTIDGGAGPDDLAVFVMSTGETLVYQGADPSSATDWSLVGRFQIGEPLSVRASCKYGPSVMIATKDGYVDLAKALRSGRYNDDASLSAKISRAVRQAASAYASTFGWDAILYPAGGLLLVNVPDGTYPSQHVMNTSTGAWCRFQHRATKVYCFTLFGDDLYLGTDVGIAKYCKNEVGNHTDWAASNDGQQIKSIGVQAFQKIQSGRRVLISGLQFVTNYGRPQFITAKVGVDYYFTISAPAQDNIIVAGTPSDFDTVYESWQLVSAYGESFAPIFAIDQGFTRALWYETRLRFKPGGGL
jgi:hypothetical protein